jgi:hypothetical protein
MEGDRGGGGRGEFASTRNSRDWSAPTSTTFAAPIGRPTISTTPPGTPLTESAKRRASSCLFRMRMVKPLRMAPSAKRTKTGLRSWMMLMSKACRVISA